MENFTVYNPTKLHFGVGVISNIHQSLKKYGKKALIIYGKGSVKKYGYLDALKKQLNLSKTEYVEYGGIKPNPVIDDVRKAVEVAKNEKIDFIIAIGGGSVIDSAKMINLSYANNIDAWDIMTYREIPKKRVPLITVLTIAATGSEMNGAAVLQNPKTMQKIGYASELNYPDESFLDPSLTLTVPKDQTINGIVDLIAHSLEAFFAYGDAPLSDRFIAQVIIEAMDFAEPLLNNLKNITLRERMMWTATVALNGTLYAGKASSGDWGVHALGHTISMLYDTPHGQTLSIMYPAWLKHFKAKIPERIAKLGKLITANKNTNEDQTIEIIENFFKKIGAPTRLQDINLTENHKKQILELLIKNKVSGMNFSLDEKDYEKILNFAMQ